jgi:hypothetical protein
MVIDPNAAWTVYFLLNSIVLLEDCRLRFFQVSQLTWTPVNRPPENSSAIACYGKAEGPILPSEIPSIRAV